MTAKAAPGEPARRPVTLFSPLPPEEVARRLKVAMDAPMADAPSRVFGKGSQHEMQLRYLLREKQTGLEPVLIARMEEHDGGTRITGDYGPPVSPRILACGCYAFLSFFIVTGLLIMISDWLFGLIFTAVPLFVAYVGRQAMQQQARKVDESWEKIAAFLSAEIDAHPVS